MLNGRGIWDEKSIESIRCHNSYRIKRHMMATNTIHEISLSDMFSYMESVEKKSKEFKNKYLENIWDAIFFQSEIIQTDFKCYLESEKYKVHPSVVLENSQNIFIGKGTEIKAGSILDATKGPIIIENHVTIDIGALIQGPVFIGPQCIINPGSKLRGNITVGSYCKLGGEIEDTIFQGFSNKQHDGYLGHSYIGEWVNLGANTNNSDLKNNYGNIRIQLNNEIIDTNKQFLGVMIGDYSRTGISTMINTGTIIGLGANIFGQGFQNKYIPSFQWGENSTTKLDKFLVAVEKMKNRRNQFLSNEEKEFLKKIYKK